MFKVLHKDPPIPENLSHEGKEFLQCCFKRNPAERPAARELLDHPFIRNSSHYNKHGSIHSFAGIKVNVRKYFSHSSYIMHLTLLQKERKMESDPHPFM
jgi:serine/threonine protein kinase